MQSDLAIIISTDSIRTNDEDVNKMFDLIRRVVKKGQAKIYADFDVSILNSDEALGYFAEKVGVENDCEHGFSVIINNTGAIVPLKRDDVKLKCVHCDRVSQLIGSADEYAKIKGINLG